MLIFALAGLVLVALAATASGLWYVVLGHGSDRKAGVKRLTVGGLLLLLLAVVLSVPACAPVRDMPVGVAAPGWMLTPVPTVDVGIDALHAWDCQTQPETVCTEMGQ
jgi:hypothetical protein